MGLTRPKAVQIDFDVTNITDPLIRINSGESGSAQRVRVRVGTGSGLELGLPALANSCKPRRADSRVG